jgi:hypothetical protein
VDTTRPGDRARVTARVEVPPSEAFRIFTEEIDQWCMDVVAFVASNGRWWGDLMMALNRHATR